MVRQTALPMSHRQEPLWNAGVKFGYFKTAALPFTQPTKSKH